MNDPVVNLENKLAKINAFWSPRIIAQMNDYYFKLAKIQGEFVWHSHADTDEVFLVLDGELHMQLREQTLTLKKGDLYVVPKGVEHRPVAKTECHILLVEPAGTINTGDVGGELTVEEKWI